MVDLRGHGESDGRMEGGGGNIEEAARDVKEAIEVQTKGEGVEFVVGHSLGGKIGLKLAEIYGREKGIGPREYFILDSIPGRVDRGKATGSEDSVRDVINAVDEVGMPIVDKKSMMEDLEERGITKGVAMWMTTNLRKRKEGDGFEFTFDVPTARSLFDSFGDTDMFPYLRSIDGGDGVRVHIVKAGRNQAWGDVEDDMGRVGEGVVVHELEKAGHWVHVDDLEGVVRIVSENVRG